MIDYIISAILMGSMAINPRLSLKVFTFNIYDTSQIPEKRLSILRWIGTIGIICLVIELFYTLAISLF